MPGLEDAEVAQPNANTPHINTDQVMNEADLPAADVSQTRHDGQTQRAVERSQQSKSPSPRKSVQSQLMFEHQQKSNMATPLVKSRHMKKKMAEAKRM